MAGIGRAIGGGPPILVDLTDADCSRIAAAVHPRTIELSTEVRQRIVAVLRGFAQDQRSSKNEPSWYELRELIEPIVATTANLINAIDDLIPRRNETEREKMARDSADRLILAHHSDDGTTWGGLYLQVARMHRAARLAQEACVKRQGRDTHTPLDIGLSELRKIYEDATALRLRRGKAPSGRADRKQKLSAAEIIAFAHECFRVLPFGVYPYRNTGPDVSRALYRRFLRHIARKTTRPLDDQWTQILAAARSSSSDEA